MFLSSRLNVLDEKGNALVEFVLILPLFLLLIFGIIEVSLLLSNKMILNYATYMGARSGIVNERYAEESVDTSARLIIAGTSDLKSILPGLGGIVFSTDVTKKGNDLYVETEYKAPGLFPLTSKLMGRSLPFLPFSWFELKSNYKMRIEK